jgi:hypothetical protein
VAESSGAEGPAPADAGEHFGAGASAALSESNREERGTDMGHIIISGTLLLYLALICGGCAYGGIATTADGSTIYVARNDLLFSALPGGFTPAK